jgi:hypothetical protein
VPDRGPEWCSGVLVTVLLLWIAILGARLIRLSRVRPREPAL